MSDEREVHLDPVGLAAAIPAGSNMANEYLVREIITAYLRALPQPKPTVMSVEAKPCPFCGETSALCHPNDIAPGGSAMEMAGPSSCHYVHCDSCGADGPGAESYGEAFDLWNARALASLPVGAGEPVAWRIATDDEVEALARECDWDNRKYMTPADYAIWCGRMRKFARLAALVSLPTEEEIARKFKLGDRVRKIKGSSWQGPIAGFYSTTLTPIGYCVESEREPGSVQVYPQAALERVD